MHALEGPAAVSEPARRTPVRDTCDVLVAGAGLGGVAAALAAARAGAEVILVERNAFAGGTATAGMCCSVFNCYFTGDGRPAVAGIPVEIADAFAEATGYGSKWRAHKGHVIYDLERAKTVLDAMLKAAGVRVIYNAWTAGAVLEGARVRGVFIETKSGREAILAKVVVDATGDADVAASAGAPVKTKRQSLHSLCFRIGNVDVDAFVDYFRSDPDRYPERMDVNWTAAEAIAQYDDCGTFLFPHGGGIQLDCFQRAKADGALPERIGIMDAVDACQMHALKMSGVVHVITGFAHFDGLDANGIARSLVDGRRMAHAVTEVFRRYVPGFADAFVVGTASNLGVRSSRWIDGEFRFTREMMREGVRQPDAVGRAVGWDAVVLHSGPGAWAVQRLRSDSFDLPWRCLLPRGVDGIVMGAGRSISADAPELLRVMVHTMVVGQAAGAGAAVAALTETTPHTVDVGSVQDELERQAVCIR